MRISTEKRTAVGKSKTHDAFWKRILAETTAEERRASLLLVGGASIADQNIRHAQAAARLDQLASYWSHAALILEFEGPPEAAFGVEVTASPERPELQTPERNGVTTFRLARYLDAERWPNLGYAVLRFEEHRDTTVREAIREAALNPNTDRFRFRFLDWLAVWTAYAMQPIGRPNPLLELTPVPGAALCEYAFEAAGIDLTPGATAPNASPETLWSTVLYWAGQMRDVVKGVRVWQMLGDPECRPRKPLPPSLTADFAPPKPRAKPHRTGGR